MPNIMICGFEPARAEGLKAQIDAFFQSVRIAHDAVTSIVPMQVESCDGHRTPSPYLCVRATNPFEIHRIVEILKVLNEDIEWEQIGGFIPANK